MILFVDFDGVLHPEPSGDQEMFCYAEPLWNIMRACPEVRVVLSTSWRELYSLEQLLEFVTHGGGEYLQSRFIGTTPILADLRGEHGYRRHAECLSFLQANGLQEMHWLALDDHADDFPPCCPNLYLTNKSTGLTHSDRERIISMIKNSKQVT